jgi:Zn-dependent protease/CBS domain-containing protein
MTRQQPDTQVARRRWLGAGVQMGTLFGVNIHVDWSLLIIFALILFNLGAGVFPYWHPDWSPALVWGVALAAAVSFFASVLIHELAHAVVGRAQGIPIRRITLFLFGGLAHMEGPPPSPKSEFWMAIVGPVTSIVFGVAATLLGAALAGAPTAEALQNPQQVLSALGPLPTLLLWLGPINVLLGVFNIVPGFPLDGGRVLRSILWGITGDLRKATHWATGAGRAVAWLLIGIGALTLFSGALLQGMWLLLIGWFLNNAARMSYQQLLVRQALADVPVTRVMRTRVHTAGPDTSVDSLVREVFLATDQQSVPIESGGRLIGLVSLAGIRRVPQERWSSVRASEIMAAADDAATLPPDAPAERALEKLAETEAQQIAVVDGDRVLGLVSGHDLFKWLSFHGVQTTGA